MADSGDSGGRHKLTHLELVHPDDVDRFAEIGVIADPQVRTEDMFFNQLLLNQLLCFF